MKQNQFPRQSRDQQVGAIPKVTRPACAVIGGGFNSKRVEAIMEYNLRIYSSGWIGPLLSERKGHPVMERLA